ncbi:MAG: hypothetical protein ACK56F_12355, partial [bacterium]
TFRPLKSGTLPWRPPPFGTMCLVSLAPGSRCAPPPSRAGKRQSSDGAAFPSVIPCSARSGISTAAAATAPT